MSTTKTDTLQINGPYPTASYPYGRPTAERTVWHISTLARRVVPGSIFPDLPVSAWTVTRYDDKPGRYNVHHDTDNSPKHFTARSFRAVVRTLAAYL